jgi:hypothetical protein
MKKTLSKLFVLALAVFATQGAFAQGFERGDKLLNVGIGGGGYGYYSGYGGVSIGASFEAGISDFISIGAQADFRFYSYNWGAGSSSYVSMPIAARGSYHFGKHFLSIDNLDLYGGPVVGVNIDGSKYYTGNKVVIGAFAGGRYYFANNFGAFLEFSGGNNVVPAKVGIALKF